MAALGNTHRTKQLFQEEDREHWQVQLGIPLVINSLQNEQQQQFWRKRINQFRKNTTLYFNFTFHPFNFCNLISPTTVEFIQFLECSLLGHLLTPNEVEKYIPCSTPAWLPTLCRTSTANLKRISKLEDSLPGYQRKRWLAARCFFSNYTFSLQAGSTCSHGNHMATLQITK